ncbi:MAG TPA: helix-turn-helix domain-containing protein [Pyrinomonadaceae bacterium]|nr:helix-turn-helix domain-containing protein [Pyrinomonadaceae bacterium]
MKRTRKKPHQVHIRDRGVYIFESRHSPDFEMELVAQDFHHLYVVREGRGFIETEDDRLPVRENQLLYVPAHVAHRPVDDPGAPLTLVILCFYDSVFGDCNAALEGMNLFRRNFPALSPFKVADNYTRLEVRNRLKALFVEQTQQKEGSRPVILSQLIELLVFAARTYAEHRELSPTDPGAAAFAGSLQYLDDNFYKPIKIEDLADLANMSYRTYTEQFKRRTGKTVTQYVTERRVEYAKRLMLETDDILFASVEAGFGDLTHFYRVFKKATGLTPKQFITDRKPDPARPAAA